MSLLLQPSQGLRLKLILWTSLNADIKTETLKKKNKKQNPLPVKRYVLLIRTH